MKFRITTIAALLAVSFTGNALAAVSAEEAAKLKSTLTPLGAEKAGNKDGSIPAWDGGFTKVPAGYKPGNIRPDFFAGEKPLYTVTAKNMDQYADKLTDGVKGLLQKYPDYRLVVYPTHRTAAAPQSVYDNTFKNATRAKLTGAGFTLEGAFGGIPFPIPKNGNEVMWNHILAWTGVSALSTLRCYSVTANGKIMMVSQGNLHKQRPYYYEDGSLDTYKGAFEIQHYVQTAPPSKAGESILAHDYTDATPRGIWQYLVGQRRVRRAPSVAYDTPDSVTSGASFFDEAFLQFGPWDLHEYKLLGKKEILVPYNNNRAIAAKPEELYGEKFLNPDQVRWELHRVWVVEANLAPGKRHVVPKRKYYYDEDTWQALLLDGWDAQGKLWRTAFDLPLLAPDYPAVLANLYWGVYNLQAGGYFVNAAYNGLSSQVKQVPKRPETYFSPEELSSMSAR
jgi:hypothetical protein